MIMMNGDCPVPATSPSLPVSATLPSVSDNLEAPEFSNGPPACTGCDEPIEDEFILRVQGHMWHAHCLRCAACQTSLSQMCYVRGTRVFCRMDFFRLFGASCAGCGEVIPPSDVVRRAHENIYHTKCFACVMCATLLNTGDEFYLRDDGRLICKADFQNVRDSAPQDNQDDSQQDFCQSQEQQPPVNLSNLTFTQQETEILQELYHACPNPSHETLQRISVQHGMDVTRVRVWFHVHGKENGARDCGINYSREVYNGGVVQRAVPPPGGYPLPIVNEAAATPAGRLPRSSGSNVPNEIPFPVTSLSSTVQPCLWPLSDDVLRPDFVPPNVDLNPSDIKDGEVCDSRRGLPTASSASQPGNEFCYNTLSPEKGSDCQQEQHQCGGEMHIPWIDC